MQGAIHPLTRWGMLWYGPHMATKTIVRTGRSHLVAVRLPHEMLARIDALAAALSIPGLPVTRTDAIRATVAAGLDKLEQERPDQSPTASRPAAARRLPSEGTRRGLRRPRRRT